MATRIRLNKQTKTIKVVNRRENIKLTQIRGDIKLQHTGKTGPASTVQGPIGETGADGKSAYELAVTLGFAGTLEQWLESLKALDKTYTQSFTAQSTVTVVHNLGKLPSVNVIDSAGDEVEGEVYYESVNVVIVTFSYPTSGRIICN